MPPTKSTKIVLDVESPRCRTPYFNPAGRKLQTTIRADRLKNQGGVSPLITAVGEIPGERIEIDLSDGDHGSAVISHRWGYPENAERRAEFNKHAANMRATRIIDPAWLGTPPSPENYVFHSEDDKAYWLFWVRRLVDTGELTVVKGEVPELEEIRTIGDIRKCQNYGFQDPKVTILPKKVAETAGA